MGFAFLMSIHPKNIQLRITKKNGSVGKSIKIFVDEKLMKTYDYGVFEHEVHRVGDQKHSLILVADNSDDTGVYTRAF